jgi:hypothetical protein
VPVVAEDGEALLLADAPPGDPQGDAQLAPAVERHA